MEGFYLYCVRKSRGAFLVAGGKIEEFKEAARRLNQEIQKKGLDLEFSGPWPAYHFATPEN